MTKISDLEQSLMFIKLKGLHEVRLVNEKDTIIIYAENKYLLVSVRIGSQIIYTETPKIHKD